MSHTKALPVGKARRPNVGSLAEWVMLGVAIVCMGLAGAGQVHR